MPSGFLREAMAPEAGRRIEVAPGEVRLRQLTGDWEIAEVAHLRSQIQLPAAVLADPGFAALEKKETGSAWSRRSSSATSPLAH
jgi:hypothetical protein